MSEGDPHHGGELPPATRASSADGEAPAGTTGVLFVHGIGQQAQGDTLIGFGQPLVEWIRRWVEGVGSVEGEPRGATRILECGLGEPTLEPGTPAHLELEIQAPAADWTERPRQSRWLVAESWWATEFRNPPFGRLAAWLLGVGAWMILSHAGKVVRRLRSWRRWLLGPPVFAASLLAAFLVQIIVAAIAILALLPIPPLRNALSGLLLKLTGTIGDSYVLVSSPVQRAAAITRLRKDLDWLSERSDRVVVVAHSQGAAIAHAALKGRPRGKVRKLVTHGAGIGKLEELKLLMRPSARLHYLSAQFGLPLTTIALILLPRALPALFRFSWDFAANFFVVFYLFVPLFLIANIIFLNWRGWSEYSEHIGRELPLTDEGIEWCDCYATADPIPNGPLGGSPEEVPWLQAKQVVNRSSAISDHSTYWSNLDQFVPWVVQTIDEVARSGLIHEQDEAVLKLAAAKRPRRVRFLSWAGVATIVSLAASLVGLRTHVIRLGEVYLWQPLIELLDGGVLEKSLRAVLVALQSVVTAATAVESEGLSAAGFALLAVLPLAVLAGLWYAVMAWFWTRADQAALGPLFERSTEESSGNVSEQWLFMVALSALLPVIFAVATLVRHDPREALDVVWTISRWTTNAGCWLFLLMTGLGLAYAVVVVIIMGFRLRHQFREQGTSVWAVLGKGFIQGVTGLWRRRPPEGPTTRERSAPKKLVDGYGLDVQNESRYRLGEVRIELDQAGSDLGDLGPGDRVQKYGFASRIPGEATVTWRSKGREYRQVLSLAQWESPEVREGTLRFVFVNRERVEVSYKGCV